MSFLTAVEALRTALDVPASMPLPAAVKHMCQLMGVEPGSSSEGAEPALPVLVAMLVEVTGVRIEQPEPVVSDLRGDLQAAEVSDTNELGKVKRQRKKRPHPCPVFVWALSVMRVGFTQEQSDLSLGAAP